MKFAVALSALVASAAAIAPLHRMEERIEGSYIVVFKTDSTTEQRAAHMAMTKSFSATDSAFNVQKNWDYFSFKAYAGLMSETSLEAIRADDAVVDFVEEDSIVRINAPVENVKTMELMPNVTSYLAGEAVCTTQTEVEWGLQRTSQRDLQWTGEYLYRTESSGQGVDAYILDTGIMTTHVEFEGRAVVGAFTIPDPGYDGTDGNGHGTHVAGSVMSARFGVAKKARAIAVKVLGAGGSGSMQGVIDGVDWTCKDHTDKKNKCVANMSLGGGRSDALNRAVIAATECGCSFAVASGNSNADACNFSPAGAGGPTTDVLTVNSMDDEDRESSFSNYGRCTDIYAPGTNILSTFIGSNTATRILSGTSMASPHACGVMALIAQKNDMPKHVKDTIIRTATEDKIDRISRDSPNLLAYHAC